jgi:YHS domain-containing protein
MNRAVRLPLAAAFAVVVASAAFALPRRQDAPKPAAPGAPAAAPAPEKKVDSDKPIVPFFGNETCPMTGKPINKSKYVESAGQKAYFCCNNCLAKAKADPKAAVAAAYKAPTAIANKTCPVSGHAIEAGKGVEVAFESRKIQLCCQDCVKEFNATPLLCVTKAVYGAEDLKNKTCPVMAITEKKEEASCDDDLVVYKGKIVRLCCSECQEEFPKNADAYLAKASGH